MKDMTVINKHKKVLYFGVLMALLVGAMDVEAYGAFINPNTGTYGHTYYCCQNIGSGTTAWNRSSGTYTKSRHRFECRITKDKNPAEQSWACDLPQLTDDEQKGCLDSGNCYLLNAKKTKEVVNRVL